MCPRHMPTRKKDSLMSPVNLLTLCSDDKSLWSSASQLEWVPNHGTTHLSSQPTSRSAGTLSDLPATTDLGMNTRVEWIQSQLRARIWKDCDPPTGFSHLHPVVLCLEGGEDIGHFIGGSCQAGSSCPHCILRTAAGMCHTTAAKSASSGWLSSFESDPSHLEVYQWFRWQRDGSRLLRCRGAKIRPRCSR